MTHNLEATVFVYRSHKDKTIKAEYLEQARLLEDSPDWEHIATLEPRMWIECHYAKTEALAQPEQEPYAWEFAGTIFHDRKEVFDWYERDDISDIPPLALYTTPPQRKPLTDEQIWDAYMKAPVDIDCHVSDLHKFARAIEAAHGIKGDA